VSFYFGNCNLERCLSLGRRRLSVMVAMEIASTVPVYEVVDSDLVQLQTFEKVFVENMFEFTKL
jgi:hypothetical protein